MYWSQKDYRILQGGLITQQGQKLHPKICVKGQFSLVLSNNNRECNNKNHQMKEYKEMNLLCILIELFLGFCKYLITFSANKYPQSKPSELLQTKEPLCH